MTPDQARLVTVSASYGAGGSVVAPALARRLGVPFLQRVTATSGGTLTPGAGPEPCTERLATDETDLTPPHRLLAALTQAMPAGPTQSPPSSRHQQEHLRRHCEEGIRRLAAAGAGVILGRPAPLPPGDRLHRDTPGRRHRGHPAGAVVRPGRARRAGGAAACLTASPASGIGNRPRMSVTRDRITRQRFAGGVAAPRRGRTEPRHGAGRRKCMRGAE